MLPPEAKKTYSIRAPIATHWRSASCAEVDCELYTDGWRLRAELLSEGDLHLIRESGRKWTELQIAEGETWLVFSPGTPCLLQWSVGQPFTERNHKVQARPEVYLLTPGDWRMWCGEEYRFRRSDQWVEDFGEHQERLADRARQG
jgi:hypothetical protein